MNHTSFVLCLQKTSQNSILKEQCEVSLVCMQMRTKYQIYFCSEEVKMNFYSVILSKKYLLLHVDWYKCLWAFIGGFKRFSGLQSSLGITNVNRSHNKPLELIETI